MERADLHRCGWPVFGRPSWDTHPDLPGLGDFIRESEYLRRSPLTHTVSVDVYAAAPKAAGPTR
jgi:hypothetical protein